MSDKLFESRNWSAAKEALVEGLSGNRKTVMETVLENTRKYMTESAATSTTAGNVAVLNKVILPVIRRVMQILNSTS
jgi:glycerol-3-phosphate dehydrogenase